MTKKLLLAILLWLPVSAAAQYSVWSQPITNNLGQPIAGATVAVCNGTSVPTFVVPCGGSSLATIYASFSGGAQINPFYTNAAGLATVYAASANYYLQVFGTGLQTTIIPITIGGTGGGANFPSGSGIPCVSLGSLWCNTITIPPYSVLVSGASGALFVTPTGNGQCVLSGTPFTATVPGFGPCPSGFSDPLTADYQLITHVSGTPTPVPAPSNYPTVPQFAIGNTNGSGVANFMGWLPGGVLPRPAGCTSNVDTVLLTDRGGLVNWTDNSASCAVTLPKSGSTSFDQNFTFLGCDTGTHSVIITPTTSTFTVITGSSVAAGQTSLTLSTGQCANFIGDNTNYYAILKNSAGGGTVNAGTTAGDLTCYPSPTNAVSDCNIPSADVMTANTTVGLTGLWSNGFPRGVLTSSSTGAPTNGNTYVQTIVPTVTQVVGHATFNVSTCATCGETVAIGIYTSTSSAAVWCGTVSVNAVNVYSPSATQYTLLPNTRYYIAYGQSGTTAATVGTYGGSGSASAMIVTQNNSTQLAIAANGTSGAACPATLGTLTPSVSSLAQVAILLEP